MVDHLRNPLAQSRGKIISQIIHQNQLPLPGNQQILQVDIIPKHQIFPLQADSAEQIDRL